mmetsp:Transcript_27423/g.69775  ORF Transcript_27423/g.69775 Transcript_27423/m.69775 type:complete len:106 (+) Transcript_27423:1113-1430(+)
MPHCRLKSCHIEPDTSNIAQRPPHHTAQGFATVPYFARLCHAPLEGALQRRGRRGALLTSNSQVHLLAGAMVARVGGMVVAIASVTAEAMAMAKGLVRPKVMAPA